MPPDTLIARDQEWASLQHEWEAARPALAFVLGRRRAGKSFLLSRFVKAHRGIYYQATKQTATEQLRTLSRVVGEAFGDSAYQFGGTFERWDDFFAYVLQRVGKKPFLIVFDEFPFLTDAEPALPSILQTLWDHRLQESRIKLVLSGSHVSAMRQLSAGDQPLFGRRTLQLTLHPLTYRGAATFVPQYAARDACLTYGMFGGLPGYLAALDPAAAVTTNGIRQLLTPTSRLYEEAAHVFDTFLSDGAVHYSIVEAIANGEHLWSKIANRVGKPPTSITRALDWLVDMQVVARIAPITEGPKPSHKSLRYRLTDPYLKFWHQFVAPAKAMGSIDAGDPEDVWALRIAPALDGYMGEVFEEICRTFTRLDRGRHLPFRPVQVGEWWTATSDAQLDVVAFGAAGELLVGECKWGSIGRDHVQALYERAAQVAALRGNVTTIVHVAFTGGPIRDPAVQHEVTNGRLLHIGLDDLFA